MWPSPWTAIGSGFRYNVHDQTGSLAVFGIVVVGENLKFLHFVDGCARTVASGNQLVSDVCAIYVVKIAAVIDGAGSDQVVRSNRWCQTLRRERSSASCA